MISGALGIEDCAPKDHPPAEIFYMNATLYFSYRAIAPSEKNKKTSYCCDGGCMVPIMLL